jgi:hypothetical protein
MSLDVLATLLADNAVELIREVLLVLIVQRFIQNGRSPRD